MEEDKTKCKDSDILRKMLERLDYDAFVYDATPQYVLRASYDTADNTYDYKELTEEIDQLHFREW